MLPPGFARTPRPPYYAVIFSAQRTAGDHGYAAAAARMEELALQQPGCLGVESTRGADGFGITVSYWDSEENIRNWKRNHEHAETRGKGRGQWYSHYELRVAKVERAYNFDAPETD